MADSSAPEPTKDRGALRLTCHVCQFRWESPNTARGAKYIENTRRGHELLFEGHWLTTGQDDRIAGTGTHSSAFDEGQQ